MLHSLVGGFVTDQLSALSPPPDALRHIIEDAALRLFDSSMIIEDPLTERAPLKSARVEQPIEHFDQTWVIDEIIDQVRLEGLDRQFHKMIGLFGSIMLDLTATPAQLSQVTDWLENGVSGHFLMTDTGGPTLAHWQTVVRQRGEQQSLQVNKIHGIEAHELGFAMVVAKQEGKPFPVTILLPPTICQNLSQEKIGLPFLSGQLQLGNSRGEIPITSDMFLTKGGLGSVNRFLTLVRPRFVKSLMHFVLWLKDQSEVTLTQSDSDCLEYLIGICNQQIERKVFSVHSINQVLATKLASNELLSKLVLHKQVQNVNRQRDLLAFTKMEGSSYRCYFELYSKLKGLRV